ncbi:hypothetical protein JNUCC23_08920 [Peribacillus sp. JNUCC 23]
MDKNPIDCKKGWWKTNKRILCHLLHKKYTSMGVFVVADNVPDAKEKSQHNNVDL